jgi:hypothetical protein
VLLSFYLQQPPRVYAQKTDSRHRSPVPITLLYTKNSAMPYSPYFPNAEERIKPRHWMKKTRPQVMYLILLVLL